MCIRDRFQPPRLLHRPRRDDRSPDALLQSGRYEPGSRVRDHLSVGPLESPGVVLCTAPGPTSALQLHIYNHTTHSPKALLHLANCWHTCGLLSANVARIPEPRPRIFKHQFEATWPLHPLQKPLLNSHSHIFQLIYTYFNLFIPISSDSRLPNSPIYVIL